MNSENSNANTIQRLWLEVRCSSLGSVVHEEKLEKFLNCFLSHIPSKKHGLYKVSFSDGHELVIQLCKEFVSYAKKILSSESSDALEIISSNLNEKLVRSMMFLVDSNDGAGPLTFIFENFGNYNICALLLMLHSQFLNVLEQDKVSEKMEVALEIDCLYMKIMGEILRSPLRDATRRCVSECVHESALCSVVSTIVVSYKVKGYMTMDIPETALYLFKQQMNFNPSNGALERVSSVAEDSIEYTSCSGNAKDTVLMSLACLLEVLLIVREKVGFFTPEKISFSALGSALIVLERVMSDSLDIAVRISQSIETLAVHNRVSLLDRTSEDTRKSSILNLIPGALSRIQGSFGTAGGDIFSPSKKTAGAGGAGGVGSSSGNGSNSGKTKVQCREAIECLSTVFVCASMEQTAQLYGSLLLRLVFSDTIDGPLATYVLHSCRDSFLNLTPTQLYLVCNFLLKSYNLDVSKEFIQFMLGNFVCCSVVDSASKIVLLDFFILYCSELIGIGKSLVTDGLLLGCILNINALTSESDKLTSYVEKTSVLFKILIRDSSAIPALEKDDIAQKILTLVIEFYSKGEYKVSIVLRETFNSILVKTKSFFEKIINEISNYTETRPWKAHTTVLLATFVLLLRKGKALEQAIAHNALELSFTLVRDVEFSLAPKVDSELLGCILNILLPLVAHSDVWMLFEASIGTMKRSVLCTQFVIDLCCGDFVCKNRLDTAYRVFDEHIVQPKEITYKNDNNASSVPRAVVEMDLCAKREDGYVVHGAYKIPEQPFCEFEYLLNVLFSWSTEAFEKDETWGKDFAKVVESLLLLSGVKIPNSYAVAYILKYNRLGLLPCVTNLADPMLRNLFFGEDHSLAAIEKRQNAWLSALCHPQSLVEDPENRYNIKFLGSSGATGTVSCPETWPSLDGYSVSMWLKWGSGSSISSTSDAKTNSSHTEEMGGDADRKVVVLWQLHWFSSGKNYSITFSVDPLKRCCYYSIMDDAVVQKTELPIFPLNKWVHVLICHKRGKLYPSELKIYFNGSIVSTKEFSYPFALPNAVASAGVVPAISTSVHCTVGSPEIYTSNATMSFISMSVYNTELTSENVFSIYSYGPNPRGGVKWGKTGVDKISLQSPYLHDEVLRGLEICNASKTLEEACQRQFLTFSSTQKRPLIYLHVRSMVLVESSLEYMNNKNWSFVNRSNYNSSLFLLHGNHSLPPKGFSGEVDALLSHGATQEWLQWLTAIDEADTVEDLEVLGSVARRLLLILSSAHTQELHSAMWRRFTSYLTALLIKNPKVFLRDSGHIECLLSLSIRLIPDRGNAYAKVVYYNAYLEHIFFNWKVLGTLHVEVLTYMLDILNELVSPSNSFRAFNAARFMSSDFINGFVCGLMREWMPIYVVEKAGDVIGSVLRAAPNLAEVLCGLLSVCAISVPSETEVSNTVCANLISKLPPVALSYIAAIRNIILKTVNTFWDNGSKQQRNVLVNVLSSQVPRGWFCAMMSPRSHPVSVMLSLRLFVICFMHDEDFREADHESYYFLALCLLSHSHQVEISEILLAAFRGVIWSPFVGQSSKQKSEISEDHSLNLFLFIALHLFRRQSQMLLNENKVNFCIKDCYSYFERILIPVMKQPTQTRWKKAFNAIVFTIRIKRARALLTQTERNNSGTELVSLSENDVKLVKNCIDHVLNWVTNNYSQNKRLRQALYRSDNTLNLVDSVSWPIIASLSCTDYTINEIALSSPVDKSSNSFPTTPLPARSSPPSSVSTEADEEVSSLPPPEEEEEDDDDWEAVPAVMPSQSKSFGLDALRPRDGFDKIYNSCEKLLSVHALERIQSTDLFAQTRGRSGMSAFVLALHRAIAATAKGIGSQTQDWRAAFLCTIWLKSCEQFVESNEKMTSAATKNVLALGKYVLDRMVSGLAAPPGALASFYRFIIRKMNQNKEAVKAALTGIFEWTLYITNSDYYGCDPGKASTVVSLLYSCEDVLFKHPLPTAQMLLCVVKRLLEITFYLTSPPMSSTNAGGAGVNTTSYFVCDAETRMKLLSIWNSLLVANTGYTQLDAMFKGADYDIWTNFLEHLTSPIAQGATQADYTAVMDKFFRYFCEKRAMVWRCSDHILSNVDFIMAEGGKYLKVFKKAESNYEKEHGNMLHKVSLSKKHAQLNWSLYTDTATFVDPSLFYLCKGNYHNSCVYGHPCSTVEPQPSKTTDSHDQSNEKVSVNTREKRVLHNSNIIGFRVLKESDLADGLLSEPLNHYVRYTPPLCVPFSSTYSSFFGMSINSVSGGPGGGGATGGGGGVSVTANSMLGNAPNASSGTATVANLKPNAVALLTKITGPLPGGQIHWVSNVYFLVGGETYISTIVVTQREIILVSSSQVTPCGDFFITKVRPHEAALQTSQKSSFKQEALRLFTWGAPVTGTKAAFRFAQYYRQLRSEAALGSSALVWRFFLGNISTVHQRMFQHMPCGLEMEIETGERIFIVALNDDFSFSKSMRDKLTQVIANLSPQTSVETVAQKKAALSEATLRWVGNELGTRAYLNILNDCASRTIADIGQYPVFPWILKDYTSTRLNLQSEDIYRDLSKPIGAHNPVKAAQLDKRFRQWTPDDGATPYHYGTHYSSTAIVLYYLVRLEPFTHLSIHFQGGKLDLPDRLFHSIAESWDSSSGVGSGDVKELIPEFFSLSSFLLNLNNVNLGIRRDGEMVQSVVLPSWATSAAHFVHLHALALEGSFVSEHIHEWFDLVFGYKQQGEEAAQAINVFNPFSYHEGVQHAINNAATEEEKRSIVASADNFGQTPLQLFTKVPHPKRKPPSAFYPVQHYLIRNIKNVFKHSFPSTCNYLPTAGLPVCHLYNVEGIFLNGSPFHVLSGKKPIQLFAYEKTKDIITCSVAKTKEIVAACPSIESIGCGYYTCMSVTSSGNILAVGTSRGKIIIFTRGGISGRFVVGSVFHLGEHDKEDNAVLTVNIFDYGKLIATYEKNAEVSGWHISLHGSMFLFDICLLDNEERQRTSSVPFSPVIGVREDRQKSILYGAKQRSIVLFTFSGIVLHSIPICSSAAVPRSLAPAGKERNTDSDWTDIVSLCLCNCLSSCDSNLLIVAHQGGYLTFWNLQAESNPPAEDGNTIFYRHTLLHTVNVEGEITSIVEDIAHFCVGIGMEDGSIIVMGFPLPDQADSERAL